MGRKNKSKGSAVPVELSPEVESVVEEKSKAGDAACEAKKYGEALTAYDEALKALPERHSKIADLHGCKAGVFLRDSKYKEAIKECNQGLAVEGNNVAVLRRRAQARYQTQLFKDALADIQKVNAASGDDESAALEATLRNILNGKVANGTAAGGAAVAKAAPGDVAKAPKQQVSKDQTAQMLRNTASQFTCKVTLDSETKYLQVPYGISYYTLQQVIKGKWTGLHNFKTYYQDKDSDWVIITEAKDVQKAQQEILAYAQRVFNQRQRQGLDAQPPTCRFKIEKCNRGDVPVPPKEELPKEELKSRVVVKSTDAHAEETVVELDDWLIEFANLFRDQLGIDPDRHVDMQTEGADKCSKALDTAVHLPEARGLFDEAFDRFRDVTCIGLCNWANVHLCLAKKLVEHAAAEGKPISDVEKEFKERCAASIGKYNEALSYNEKYVEAILGIGQVHIEEARAQAGILMAPLDNVDSDLYKELDPEELEELTKSQGRDSNAKLKVALKPVTPEAVQKSKAMWDEVYAQFGKAEAAAKGDKSEKTAAREASRADAAVSPPYTDETHLMANQVQIIWGNALYDQSQIWAGVGLDGWKAMVEDAKARFLSATCKEEDVIDALRNHLKAEDLELPAAPEPAAPPAPPPVEKKAPEKKVPEGGAKGLPALKKKRAPK